MIRPLDGKSPRIHPSAFISEAAYIVGDVVIGENTSIWPGAVIRADYGDIIIGKNCSIQDNVVLHTDDHLELGDNVLLTHGAVVHGGKVGSNVLIGVNAVLLEDTDVGDHVFIGAGAIVRGRVPDNSRGPVTAPTGGLHDAAELMEPVLCVERAPGHDIRPGALTRELLEIAQQHDHTSCIETVLYHDSFPVDVRHNAKIFREKLAVWAQERLA